MVFLSQLWKNNVFLPACKGNEHTSSKISVSFGYSKTSANQRLNEYVLFMDWAEYIWTPEYLNMQ